MNVCSQLFANTTTGALIEHKKNMHENDRPDAQTDRVALQPKPLSPDTCHECLVSTNTTDELEEHKKEAHMEVKQVKNIKCKKCEFLAKDENVLIIHIKSEHEENPGKTSHAEEECIPEQARTSCYKCQQSTTF